MRKYLSIFCIVVSLLFITSFIGYAESPKSTTETNLTFTLDIDDKETVINLPKDFPDMSEAGNRREHCWNANLCVATFCLSDDLNHGHARFFYSEEDVVALAWLSEEDKFKQWLYEKGVATEVSYEKLSEVLNSVFKKVPGEVKHKVN